VPVPGGPPPGFPANVLQCVPYKKPTDATVYVVGSDWLKHGFTSWATFLAVGLTAGDIRADTIGNLDLIGSGAVIDSLAAYAVLGCVPVVPPPPGVPVGGRCSSYDVGECTWGVCELAVWVPEQLGNARDWPARAVNYGLQETPVPTVGAVVCYAPGFGYSQLGHLGVVVADHGDGTFDVQEMNYTAFNQYDLRTSTLADVTTFILPPGVLPGGGGDIGPGGTVTPPQDLETAWAQFAHFWNVSIDQRVDELAAITAGLEGS
jgi:hypothetical protein